MLKLGSTGEQVRRLQEKLKELGFYRGAVDGVFGGATLYAVRRFQKANALKVDGIVGPKTFEALFPEHKYETLNLEHRTLTSLPLDYRCLMLTGTFETGKAPPECFCALSGNFDGQGISFGALQWNFGQGSLQPLLKDMLRDYRQTMQEIFGDYTQTIEAILDSKEEAMEFGNSIQHPVKHFIYEPWKGMLRELGRTREFQNIQVRYASSIFERALKLTQEYGILTERAVALMFDVIVQCGSIKKTTRAKLMAELQLMEDEESQLELIAKRVSEQVNPRWQADVLSRKLCIARGSGIVHGVWYNLEEQFGIGSKEA